MVDAIEFNGIEKVESVVLSPPSVNQKKPLRRMEFRMKVHEWACCLFGCYCGGCIDRYRVCGVDLQGEQGHS